MTAFYCTADIIDEWEPRTPPETPDVPPRPEPEEEPSDPHYPPLDEDEDRRYVTREDVDPQP